MKSEDVEKTLEAAADKATEPTYRCNVCKDRPRSFDPDIPSGGLVLRVDKAGIHRSSYCLCDAGMRLREGHARVEDNRRKRTKAKVRRGFTPVGDIPF